MPDVSIQSALGVLLNYNGLTNRFIEGSPTYITEGISDSSITSNGTIFSGTNGYLVKTFGNTTLNKYYPEFKITCSGRFSSDDNRILALEKKIEELTKIISNGINRRNEEITEGNVGDGEIRKSLTKNIIHMKLRNLKGIEDLEKMMRMKKVMKSI